MILRIQKSGDFFDDLLRQVDWYRENANSEVADRFVRSVQATLEELSGKPTLGRPRFHNHPQLRGLRSHRVRRPFYRLLIFYRFDATQLLAERLIHGARDLPTALRERL